MGKAYWWTAALVVVAGGTALALNMWRTTAPPATTRVMPSTTAPAAVVPDSPSRPVPAPVATTVPVVPDDEPIVTRFESLQAAHGPAEAGNLLLLSGGQESEADFARAPRPDPETRCMPYADETCERSPNP